MFNSSSNTSIYSKITWQYLHMSRMHFQFKIKVNKMNDYHCLYVILFNHSFILTWLCLHQNWKQQICRWRRRQKTQWCERSKRWCWRGVCSWQLGRQDTGTWSTDSGNGWNINVLCAKLPEKTFQMVWSAPKGNFYTSNIIVITVFQN